MIEFEPINPYRRSDDFYRKIEQVDLYHQLDDSFRSKDSSPSRVMRDFSAAVGWLVGVVVFGLSFGLIVSGIYTDWDKKVAYHKTHVAPGWRQERGTIVKQLGPHYYGAGAPATIRSRLRFVDYFGKVHYQGVRLPYYREGDVGETVQVDVSNTGQIWVPGSPDYAQPPTDQDNSPQYEGHWDGPFTATPGFTPGAAVFCWLLATGAVGLIVGCLAALLTDVGLDYKGRIGSR